MVLLKEVISRGEDPQEVSMNQYGAMISNSRGLIKEREKRQKGYGARKRLSIRIQELNMHSNRK